ncbi:MAG: DNA polymerase I, partial [Nitrospinota bacterium]
MTEETEAISSGISRERVPSMAEAEEREIYLIDGSSYIFRAYYAIKERLSTTRGLPTGAVFGFANMLLKVLREKNPRFLAIAFDHSEPTFRHKEYSLYKANRKAMPEDLALQIPYIRRLVGTFRIPLLEVPGFEADDLLGTAAVRAAEAGFRVILVSGDKDLLQLVSPAIRMWDPMKDKLYGEAEVRERFGVEPSRVVEIMGLMGDSSDNIPGVPGIGEKTASALIQEFGDIENLLKNLEKVKRPKQRQALAEHADMARLSKHLCTIDTGARLEAGPEELRFSGVDREEVLGLFRELEFQRLVDQLPASEAAPAEVGPGERGDYRTVLERRDFEVLIKELKGSGAFALDLETTHLEPMRAKMVGMSLSWAEGKAAYIPIAHDYPDAPGQLPREEVLSGLKPLLEDPALPKYGQNIKYDLIVLSREGVSLKGVGFDPMVASYLVNPSRPSHGLEALALEYLGRRVITYADVAGTGKTQKSFNEVPIEAASRYSCEDADLAYRLVGTLRPKLKELELEELFHEVELPLIEVLASMEMRGVRVDEESLRELGKELGVQMEASAARIYEMAGMEFNINSPIQLRGVLFDKLKLPVLSKTKTGPSTSTDVLEKLAPRHPLPAEIVGYRQLAKLKSTYVDTLPTLINPETGRIHTSFNQTVTATGRLSSSEPNLQNIPIRTEFGRRIRQAFVPEEGSLMVSCDYSQIELRVLAHLSGDEGLVRAFQRGEDIHSRTACELFSVSPDKVTPEMRRIAKVVNFGVVYGLSAYRLSQDLGLTMEEANGFINNYFTRYSGVPAFIQRTVAEA